MPLVSAFGFSNGSDQSLIGELKKYGFEADRVADYGKNESLAMIHNV